MFRLFFSIFILVSSFIFSSVYYDLSDFEDQPFRSGLSFVTVDDNGESRSFAKMNLSPDLGFSDFALGLDLNLYIPTDGGDIPTELQAVSLRHIGYDYQNEWGFKWGHLTNITYGYGLLVNGYDSGSFGSSEFNTDKAGFRGYGTVSSFKFDGFFTASQVKAGRLSYSSDALSIAGAPLVFGLTYATDVDGVNRGATIQREEETGYAADIALPLAGDFLTLYTEYARLEKPEQRAGYSVGFGGDFFNSPRYRFEYRSLETGFAPGYFNETYEATPFNFSTDVSAKPISGFLGSLGADFLDGRFKSDVIYEKYEGRDPLITAAIGWRRIANTIGVINYTQSFNGSHAIAVANVLYKTGNLLDYVVTVKRVFLTDGNQNDSYSFSARINIDALSNALPF